MCISPSNEYSILNKGLSCLKSSERLQSCHVICSRECLVPGLLLQAMFLFLAAVLGAKRSPAHNPEQLRLAYRDLTFTTSEVFTVFSQPLLAYSPLPAANFFVFPDRKCLTPFISFILSHLQRLSLSPPLLLPLLVLSVL